MSEQSPTRVALVITAHADDAEFSCAGTVARWVNEGWDVYYVLCTDGSSGGPDEVRDVNPAARQRTVETRIKEQQAACALLGVKDVIFLGYPDGQLQPTIELRQDIVRLLRRFRPSRVICQSPTRSWPMIIPVDHPDHLAAGEATLSAIYPASQNPWDFPELLAEGLEPHKVSEVYVINAPMLNFIVDISAHMETKIAALRAHESQLASGFEQLEPMVRSWAGESGKKLGVAFAEEFHRAENF